MQRDSVWINNVLLREIGYRELTKLLGGEAPVANTLTQQGNPTSTLNVLGADGFNIVEAGAFPGMYSGSRLYSQEGLRLVKNNGMQAMPVTTLFFKPDPTGYAGTSVFDDNWNNGAGPGNPPTALCRGRGHFNDQIDHVWSTEEFKDVVWGYKMTEEAAYGQPNNPHDYPIGWDDCSEARFIDVPTSNVSEAIGHFKNRLGGLGVGDDKMVVMEAYHGGAINDNTNYPNMFGAPDNPDNPHPYCSSLNSVSVGFNQPQNYIDPNLMPSMPDVFFEGSYSGAGNWTNELDNYDAMQNGNASHWLGVFKSVDYAKNKVPEVHDVVNIAASEELHQYPNTLRNANLLWFYAYTSIIHGAKGIWFWDFNQMYDDCGRAQILNTRDNIDISALLLQQQGYEVDCPYGFPQDANGSTAGPSIDAYLELLNSEWDALDGRFRFDHFPRRYRDYVRHLVRELKFLTDKGLLSSDDQTVLFWKTDHTDSRGIVPDAGYIDIYAQINATNLTKKERKEITNQNYTLRYTVRTNGEEVIMIISNPLPFTVNVHLDFSGATDNRIIKNSEGVDILFAKNNSVYSPNYKTDRNSGIDFQAGTVDDQVTLNFQNDYELDLLFGPLDVHVLRFRMKGAGEIAGKWGAPEDSTYVHQMVLDEIAITDQDDLTLVEEQKIPEGPGGLKVIPNPNSGKFRLSGDGIEGFAIYDVYGKLIYTSQSGGRLLDMDLNAYGKGVYIAKIRQGNNIVTRKIVYQ